MAPQNQNATSILKCSTDEGFQEENCDFLPDV
jgi:hypothetical protein